MMKLNKYYAKVIDITDPDKIGKIKIKILPVFKDISDDLLPWAKPFITTGMTDKEYDFHPPTVGSKILVLVDQKFRYFYYVHGVMISGLFDYDSIKSKLDTISQMSDTAYPNVDFNLMNDGSIRFYNRETGDMGVLHNTGSYTIIDTNGYITIYEATGNKVSLDDTGILIEDSNGNSSIFSSTGIVIKDGNGNEINMVTAGIKLKTGDAITWMPNILPSCLFTGAPHGGSGGGITKLTGG